MNRISFYKADVTELEKNLLDNVIESKLLTVGPFMHRFQEEVRRFLNAPYFLATASGTAALHIATKVLGWGEGDEVMISPLIHVGVANTLVVEKVAVRLVDIDPERLSLDPSKVREVLERDYVRTPNGLKNKNSGNLLKGIVLYHIYGIPARVEEFLRLKEEFGLQILEVCWESFASKYRHMNEYISTGIAGDAGVFSFTRYGVVNVGEGGGVAFKNKEDFERGDMLRYHGIPSEYVEYQAIMGGFNYNIDELSCAVGLGQMMRISEILKRRTGVYEAYRNELKGVEGVNLLQPVKDTDITWYSVVVKLSPAIDRGEVIQFLLSRGIPTKVFYPALFRLQFYRNLVDSDSIKELKVADSVCSSVLSLPFYGDLTEADIAYVVGTLKDALVGFH